MPEIQFKGKEFVYNHHLSVPYRPIIPHKKKSIGDGNLSDNLIIHGDNLHALKALLPLYSSKVDCVFIDPPYNTGNENWCYNDNVNSPMLKEWLSSNPVNKEDMLRHDKWLAMMYPRVKLLHELLSDNGSLWMTLDDNEVHHARALFDEVFGEDSFVGQLVWQKRTSRENRAPLSSAHDHLLLYAKSTPDAWKLHRNLLEPSEEGYANPDDDPRGKWKSIPFSAQGYRKNQVYDITTPSGNVLKPPRGRCWGATEPEFRKLLEIEKRIYFPKDGDGRPRVKQFPEHEKGLVPMSIWFASEVGDTEESKKEILEIFEDDLPFGTPKPTKLIQRIVQISTQPNSLVLDSFAGSGTTAHSVLLQNKKDGGNRKFILVECEDYADKLTAERVRRVIKGYKFTGKKTEELLSQQITFTSLKKADEILERVAGIENLEAHRFDSIEKKINDGVLVVTGEKAITDKVEGLGGSFTYCTLGDPIDMDKILTGESLPDYKGIGAWLFHTATGEALKAEMVDEAKWFLGESSGFYVWLIYKPDLEFLKSRESALTLNLAETIAKRKSKRHLVFASAKYVPNKTLLPLGVEYAPLPFALYRVEK